MGYASLLVLFFHFLPTINANYFFGILLNFYKNTAYIGVDIFFFLSGYMLMFSDTNNFFIFFKKKLLKTYPLFIIFTFIFALLNHLAIIKIVRILGLVDIFISGGSSFLWFIQALILLYILGFLYKKILKKYNEHLVLLLTIIIYMSIMILLNTYTNNHSANIFLARIPIFLLGLNFSKYENKVNDNKIYTFIILFIIGLFLLFFFGYQNKLNYPFQDFYYITAIPMSLSLIMFIDFLDSYFKFKILNFLGKITLELYAVQMTFGFLLLRGYINLFKNIYISSFMTIISVVFFSYVIHLIYYRIIKINDIKKL